LDRLIIISPVIPEEQWCFYHVDILKTFDSLYECFFYGRDYPGYDPNDSVGDIVAKAGFTPDAIVFGTATEVYGYEIKGMPETSIPKLIFLNKVFKDLSGKLEFIKRNRFDCVTTWANEDYCSAWEASVGIPFVHTSEGVDLKMRCLDIEKDFDFGFIGTLRRPGMPDRAPIKEWAHSDTFNRITVPGNEIKDGAVSLGYDILWGDEENGGIEVTMKNYDLYVELLNRCKTFLSTFAEMKLVSLRFYELMVSKTLILCPRGDYGEEFIDEETCVMYGDIPDFQRKLMRFVSDDRERSRIVENAYEKSFQCSWEKRIVGLMERFEEIVS